MVSLLPFLGTARFQVRRCLGAGGFGTVYEAFDRKRSAIVALKVLHQANPDELYRFKQEFRALSGITHRNLVTLYELRTEEDQWFFSMEFVQGADFLSYLRGASAEGSAAAPLTPDDSLPSHVETIGSTERLTLPDNGELYGDAAPNPQGSHPVQVRVASFLPLFAIEQLLGALRQLAEGLLFLHEQGLVHRDIKPANVLCTPLGRVVLLDFGLVQELSPGSGLGESFAAGIAGTPDYMAPEQSVPHKATAAADWYSVGVMLYEVIAGRLPFCGTIGQVLRQKTVQDPPPLRERSDVPPELRALCMQLLHRQPELRPTGKEVLKCLRELEAKLGFGPWMPDTAEAGSDRRGRSSKDEPPFIGRQRQLQDLADAFAASRQGKSVVALCAGESGVGKSALCKRFVKELSGRDPELMVLSGRCYAHEDVPFKALDGVVDSLSRFLSNRPRQETEALLPRDISAASRLFPVLLRVPAIKEAPPLRIADDLQVRKVAFTVLRELMSRLSEQRPVVLYIDDLQWGDPDGISLLLELLRPPDPPRLLLIAAYRSDEEASSAALRILRKGMAGELGQSVSIIEVRVDALPAQECESLALALLPEAARERAAAVVAESGGNPFFVTELSRFFASGLPASAVDAPLATSRLTLDALIRARVARLPQAPQHLLSTLAVAGQPISRGAAALAAYGGAVETDEPQALALLRSERLVRVRYSQGVAPAEGPAEEILIYHDRIREAVVAGLSASDVMTHHLRLAQALLTSGQAEPEQMVFHLQHGGDLGGAARYAVQASAQAYAALAYHQAVRLCRAALSTGKLSSPDELVIKARLADALVGAGHPKEAAEIYLALAEHAPSELAFKRRRQAAKQLFISGHIEEGKQVLAGLLSTVGLHIPKSSLGLWCSLLYYQLLVAVRGMEFQERTEAEVSAEDLLRIDTCEAIASSTAVDPLLAANFWTQHLWYALRAGEPRRIVQALTGAAGLLFAFGASAARIQTILSRATALAERQGDAYGIGRSIFISGQIAHLEGRWRESVLELRRATEILKGECMESTALIDFIGTVEIINLRWMGDLQQLAAKVQPYLKDAVERGRKSQELNVRLSAGFLLLLREDAAARAEDFVRAAYLRLSEQELTLQHIFELEARLLILLYQGRTEEAWDLFSRKRRKFQGSGLLRMDLFQTMWRSLSALVALAAKQPLRLAEPEVEWLLRSRCVFARPMYALLKALILRRQGRHAEALALMRQAEAGFSDCDMLLHLACTRYRYGHWHTGAAGKERLAAARHFMNSQGIKNPERMAAMLIPD